jgi:hypothetical protein
MELLAIGGGGIDWDASTIAIHLTVMAVAGGLVWLAVSQILRLRSSWQRQAQSPVALFGELCRAHELTRPDRRLLADVAETVAASECCRVFIDAQILQQFARANPDDAEDCRTLSQRLFGRAE